MSAAARSPRASVTTRVVVVGALAISFLVLLVTVTNRGGTYQLRATFDDVRGLIEGGQVRAGAIKVGSVRRVFLNDDGYPEAVLEIEDDFRLHEGARANLMLGSNAGVVNRVVELTQGDPAAPTLPDGTTLTRDRTDQPVNFDEAADTLNPRTRTNIRRFLTGLEKSTRGRGRDLARTLRHGPSALNETAGLLAQANRDGAALRTVAHDGERAVSALVTKPEALGAAVDHSASLLRAAARRHAELGASARLLGPSLGRAREMLSELQRATPNLRRLIAGLDPLVDELGPLARLVPRARRAAGPFMRETTRLVTGAPANLRRLSPTIAAAFPVAETVGPLTRSALPLVQALRAYGPELGGLFQNWNSLVRRVRKGRPRAPGRLLLRATSGPCSADDRPHRLLNRADRAPIHTRAGHAGMQALDRLREELLDGPRERSMTDALAKVMAAIMAILLVTVLVVLGVTTRHPDGDRTMVVEFRDAFPLVEGMNVRVDGVRVGEVSRLRVDDDGLAEAVLALSDRVKAPRADAVAAVRLEDPGAESYVDLDPGTSSRALPTRDGTPTIACGPARPDEPCAHSLVAPRVDDLLNTFDEPTRAGLRLLLSELSQALDRRGVDVNAAALELRPALVAGNRALAEVNNQRSALKRLIEDAEAVTGQASSRRRALDRLIVSLHTTLGETASKTDDLDAGLQRLPETVRRTRQVLASLTRAARAGRPLADELSRGAPTLAAVTHGAPAFLEDAGVVLRRASPTLHHSARVLRTATPAISAAPDRLVTGAFDIAPAVARLFTTLFGDERMIRFMLGKLPLTIAEPGAQPGYPASYADRRFIRGFGILTCELFGVEVQPGCLQEALANPGSRRATRGRRKRPARDTKPKIPVEREVPTPIDVPKREQPQHLADAVKKTLDRILGETRKPVENGVGSVSELLDYLLRP